MAIELDEQAKDVQPESFRQGVEPEPEPTPEEPQKAAPAPEPEPQEPSVGPDWLYTQPSEPQAPPQPAPQQGYQQDQYYQPPPQNIPQPGTQKGLDAFINDPDGYIGALAEERAQRMIAPILQQQQMLYGMTSQMRDSQTRAVDGQAKSGIEKAYAGFNKDPAFRSNKALQQRVNSTMQTLYNQAAEAASYGDYTRLYNLANMGEREVRATLVAAKAYEGIMGGGQTPLAVQGAEVETTSAPTTETGVTLSPEQEEIARKLGGNYADKLRKAISETEKFDDFE